MNELFDLSGRVAIVTGGSRGIGKAIAVGLARAGADLVITARKQSACDEVVAEIEGLGRRALALSCEMSSPSDVEALADRAYDEFGRCDVLVNNAGVTQDALPLMEMSQQFFDGIQAINLHGPMQLATRVAKRMTASGGGSIINVISTAAIEPVGYMAAYSVSKAALRSLTRVMAEEWAPMGIRVNSIAPGPVRTDMMTDIEEKVPGFLEEVAGNTLQKRVAEPDEMVGPVIFLAADASSYMTGQTLAICGGVLKT
ncbi:MAG: SDR family oxidoreductase [Deltaproteobacteria bacterium]|nr:SDR family oxidoreductase [Deltaproteobacteria bacterium]